MLIKNSLITALGLSFLLGATSAMAGLINCGNPGIRMASLDSAEACRTGSGNTQGNGSTINGHYGPSWTEVGEETVSGASNAALFDIMLTSGSWGTGGAGGTWSIGSNFWNMYEEAVISMHVGNGGGEPDHWAWTITSMETSGTWNYYNLLGRGGGLSNLKLWGRGTAEQVPEPNILSVMALGMMGLVICRRKKQ